MPDAGPFLCAALALVGAILLAAPTRHRPAILAGWAVVSLVATLGGPTSRLVRGGQVREYTFAHYHLGARWFAELGYRDLYGQTWAAASWDVEEQRDLATYDLVPAAGVRSPVWEDAAWDAFSADVAALQPRMAPAVWRSWFRDKGYNATPAWTATLGRLVGARPASDGWFALLGALDLLLLLVALAVAGRTFGPVPALLSAAWVALFVGSDDNLIAGPLQVDWIVASILGLCALDRRRWATGGALFAWAGLSRVFPLLLLAGPLLLVRDPRWRRFLLAGAATLLAGLLVGSTTARGPAAWGEFAANIAVHSHEHHLGDQRVGLRPALAWSPVGERTDRQARQARAASWPTRAPWALALTLLLAGGAVAGLRRDLSTRTPVAVVLLGLPLVFVAVTLSRYYALLPGAALLLLGRSPRVARLGAALFALAAAAWLAEGLGVADVTVWLLVNAGFGALAVAVLVPWGAIRPRSPSRGR